jgi:DNA invertase Pin-like site-specific DNA recombinase
MGDVLGYARVSTGDQDVTGQTMRLNEAGAIRVFTDVRSGKSMDRPGSQELLAYARKGDTLAVVRLDRLGRSLAELLAIVEQLKVRGVALLEVTATVAPQTTLRSNKTGSGYAGRLIPSRCISL